VSEYGNEGMGSQDESGSEVQGPGVHTVPIVWASPGGVSEVPDLPHLLPELGPRGQDPGRSQGKLVTLDTKTILIFGAGDVE